MSKSYLAKNQTDLSVLLNTMEQLKPRERIIAIAAQLFHQQGYNSTGINEIITKANVAKSTMYQHFASKDALCVEVLKQRHNYWFDQLDKALALKNNSQDKILAAFDFIMDMNEKENFRGCNFLNIISEINPTQKEIRQVIQSHKTDLQQFMTKIAQPHLTYLAPHIYFLFESAIIESQVYRSQEPILKIKEIVESMIKPYK